MARGERREDDVRAGVGTMSRSARGARPGASRDQRPADGPDAPVPFLGRPQRQPQDPGRRAAGPAQPGPAQPRSAQPRSAQSRRPDAAPRAAGPGLRVPSAAPAPAPVRPSPVLSPAPAPAAARSTGLRRAGSHRMPFVLLLCGLLGGALVCALVISTTLAEGSFQITKLQNSTSALTRQKQVLQEQVAQQESPQVIAQEAAGLGLRRPQELLFLDLKNGKTTSDGPTWSGAVKAPGYAP
jgi:hypothetical protein